MMDEQKLDEQFQAMKSDSQVRAAAAGTSPLAAGKKRITVAELNKTIDELTELVDVNVFNWLKNLDTRVKHFENAEAEKPDSDAEDTEAHFKRLEDAIGAIAGAFRQRLEEAQPGEPAAAQEIEFAQPPQQQHVEQIHGSDVEAVAQVAQSLTDILMICRALKAAPDMSDGERSRILHVACGQAGETLTPGLQIRAGVRNVET